MKASGQEGMSIPDANSVMDLRTWYVVIPTALYILEFEDLFLYVE